MTCKEVMELLDGFADHELDLVNQLQIEQHLDECPDCTLVFEKLTAVKSALADDALYFRAPAGLRRKTIEAIRAQSKEPDLPRPRWWQWRWFPALAAAVFTAAVLVPVFLFTRPSTSSNDLLANEVVSAHVRSMMANHLMDVPSTDQHTVKPWFGNKLDFSPPVVDLAASGFELKGGRLEYLSGRPVAALIYQRRQHIINLFVFPENGTKDVENRLLVRQGFNIVYWSRSGMTFWAVSDLNLNELQEFTLDLQK